MFLPMLYVSTVLLILFYFIDTYYYNKEASKPTSTTDLKTIEITEKSISYFY